MSKVEYPGLLGVGTDEISAIQVGGRWYYLEAINPRPAWRGEPVWQVDDEDGESFRVVESAIQMVRITQ